MKPVAIDLFCGLGGWTEGLLAEGYDVTGYDIEAHEYGDARYPAKLVLADVLTLHGSQFKDAALIVASPPCQAYSYMAMPWKKGKAIAAGIRADMTGGKLDKLNQLFNACFRIQREACEAAGHHIPMVVENVRGAQPWVGRAQGNFGSYYLWGDVPALLPIQKPGNKAMNLTEATKQGGDRFNADCPGSISRRTSSKSKARKAASATIAKIPLLLARWIGATYRPTRAFFGTEIVAPAGSASSASSIRASFAEI